MAIQSSNLCPLASQPSPPHPLHSTAPASCSLLSRPSHRLRAFALAILSFWSVSLPGNPMAPSLLLPGLCPHTMPSALSQQGSSKLDTPLYFITDPAFLLSHQFRCNLQATQDTHFKCTVGFSHCENHICVSKPHQSRDLEHYHLSEAPCAPCLPPLSPPLICFLSVEMKFVFSRVSRTGNPVLFGF